MTKQICSNQTTRAQARDHLAQHLPEKEPQFGIYEITRSDHPEKNFEVVKTGEAFLQVRPSLVVGVGGQDTGLGLFTLQKIPRDTYMYVPMLPLPTSENHTWMSTMLLK